MQKQKRNRAIGAVFLALALCVTGLVPPLTAAAVNSVDTSREDCTLTVQTPENDYPKLREEDVIFQVKLYRVAQMNADGSVGTEDGMGADGFAQTDVTAYRSDAAVDELQKLAADLKAHAEQEKIAPTQTLEVKAGSGKKEDLPVGLYLVLPETITSGGYEIQFNPSLITLPTTSRISNSNYQDGDPEEERYLHELTYDAVLTLKPEHVDLVGTLRIEKELLQYREDLGPASFVFEIKAEKSSENGRSDTVYSNVVSLEFTEAGTKHIDLTDIPVGTKVAVTEIYSGAAYRPAGGAPAIWMIDEMPAAAAALPESTAHFANDYDGTQGWGTAVVNEYRYHTETETWTAPGSSVNPGGTAGQEGV